MPFKASLIASRSPGSCVPIRPCSFEYRIVPSDEKTVTV